MPRQKPKPGRYYYVQTEPVLLNDSHLRNNSIRPTPIKLTKQWLISFGFQPDASGHAWFYQDVQLVQGTNCWLCTETRWYLQFVHELQDLLEDHYNYPHLQKSHKSNTVAVNIRKIPTPS